MALLNVLFKFLRLGPWGLGMIAVAILVSGYYLHISENTQALALASYVANGTTVFGLFSKIAAAIGLLGLATLAFKSQPKTDHPLTDLQDADLTASATTTTAPQQAKDAPVCQQQSSSGALDAIDMQSPDIDVAAEEGHFKPRARNSLRKVMIGLVGGLFVLGLASTIADLIAKSAPAEVAQVQSIEGIVAAGVADAIVPDADPNRHWTDIDVTPIVEWFTAQFLLAVAGDVGAQLLLVGLFGGLVALLITIRFFFSIRSALRPKTTANFSSMGIN